ncbi:hypothetical protein AN958_10274 [Leucoagaricus sp. SymC.cos]|nr:hypothetical protein AN958_10274 [Leucoagaricus sp. SymC.cos]
MKFSLAVSAALCALAAAQPAVFRLHHRVHHVSRPQLPYAEQGTIHIADDGSASFTPAAALSDDLLQFSGAISDLEGPLDNLYYQIALQRGDEQQSSWDFTSVKACHLPHATSQTFVLHIQDTKPFAIDYFVSPIPPDGSCSNAASRSKSHRPPLSPFVSFAENVRGLNTTIVLKSPHAPPLPELRKPQPIAPTGEPLQPVPEKTFIQKYWMYIAVAFVALCAYLTTPLNNWCRFTLVGLVLTGGEEEGPRRQARA